MSYSFKGQFQFLLTEYWIVRPSKVILWRRSLSDFFAVSGENAISKWRRTSTRIPTSICPLCTARSAGDLEFESNKWGRIPMLSILFVAFVDATVVILPWTLQYSELLWINWKVNMRTHNDLPVSLFESLQQKKRELSIVCSGLRQISKFAMIVHFVQNLAFSEEQERGLMDQAWIGNMSLLSIVKYHQIWR